MCCVEYKPCSWLAVGTAWQFDLTIAAEADVDDQCSRDYIGIEGVTSQCGKNKPGADLHSRMCGGIFNLINKAAVNLASVCGKYL